MQVGGALRRASGLLHRVRHDTNRASMTQFMNQIVYFCCRNRIAGRARLIQQDNPGIHRHRPGNTKTLLLATRQPCPGLIQPVFALAAKANPQSSDTDWVAALSDGVIVMLVTDIFEDIHRDLSEKEITLPSLPDIALRVQEAASDPDCTFDSIGKVLKSDAALSANLIKIANSPLYLTRLPVTNVRAAVHRMGVPAVRNFAMTFALQNLFHSYNTGLNRLFRKVWEDNCEISALTSVLATFCAGFDPDDALLAGLIQDVGIVILIGQLAERGEDIDDPKEIREKLDQWAPSVGQMLLERWEFDQRYINVVKCRHDWMRNDSPVPDLTDLVCLARLHAYAASDRMQDCPRINQVPAYHKLPVGQLTPHMSLLLLEEARDEISEIRAMLRD